MSCQKRINLSQNKIGLPREQLRAIENGNWKLEIKLYGIAQKMLGIDRNIFSCWIKIEPLLIKWLKICGQCPKSLWAMIKKDSVIKFGDYKFLFNHWGDQKLMTKLF
jgi:hypothetical protein